MFFGNSHFCQRASWRRVSSLAALLWALALIGFAGTAYADGSGPTASQAAGPSQHHATSSTSEMAVSSSVETTADAQGQSAPQRRHKAHRRTKANGRMPPTRAGRAT